MALPRVTRLRLDVLKEIKLELIAAFRACELKNGIDYTISKENYYATHFNITVMGTHVQAKRTAQWDKMWPATKKVGRITKYKTLDSHDEQFRIFVDRECELRQKRRPKKKLDVVNEQVLPPESPPLEKAPKKRKLHVSKKTEPVVAPYDKNILGGIYLDLYRNLAKATKMQIGIDFGISTPDGTSLELIYSAMRKKSKIPFEQRFTLGRMHFVANYSEPIIDPYFLAEVRVEEVAEKVILDVTTEYNKRLQAKK